MFRPETIQFEQPIADELLDFRRVPIEFASISPYDRPAIQIALDGTKQWLDTVSPDTASAPEDRRSVAVERQVFGDYMSRMKEISPGYAERVSDIAASLPEMSGQCRLAVNMPAHNEAATIGRALQHMLVRDGPDGNVPAQQNQQGSTLDPAQYELTILANRADDHTDDGTAQAVQEFIDEYQLPIAMQVVDAALAPPLANSGMARKILHDVTVMRSLQRADQSDVLYIAAEDADIDGYDPETFDAYIKYLDSHPEKAAARMRTERNPYALEKIPHLLIKHRFMTQLITILRSDDFQPDRNPNFNFRFNRKVPSGYGTAFDAADMIRAGGFPIAESSEDLMIGEQLAISRGREIGGVILPATDIVGTVPTVVLSSARREIVSYLTGRNPYAKGNFSDTGMLEMTRRPDNELIELAQQKDVAESREWLGNQMQQGMERITATAPTPERAVRACSRLMTMAGFEADDYQMEMSETGLGLQIASWTGIEQKARDYVPSSRMARAAMS